MDEIRDAPPVVVGVEHEQPALLHYAAAWADRWHVPLRVVHAFGFLETTAELYSPTDERNAPQERAQEILSGAREYVEQVSTVPLELSVNDGPATAVLEVESKHASAVVVGTDDLSRMRQLVGAKVAVHVATHAHAPVFVVPRGSREQEIRDIVLEIDADSLAEGPIWFAFATAASIGARLRVMHVVPRTAYLADPAHYSAGLTNVVERWSALYPEVRVSPSLICGDVEDEAFVASASAQLMVVGRPNEPHRGRLLGLHVAETIVRNAQCPVVIVPAEYRP